MQLSRVWQHMASTHNIHLTSTEEYDIKSAALDDYDAERIKQGNRIMRLEADAAGDRARCDAAEKETDALCEALTELNERLIDRQQCDWKQDNDGNWDTSCKQCVCFEHAPPFEQGYKFCHHCGATINFITYKHKNDNA